MEANNAGSHCDVFPHITRDNNSTQPASGETSGFKNHTLKEFLNIMKKCKQPFLNQRIKSKRIKSDPPSDWETM